MNRISDGLGDVPHDPHQIGCQLYFFSGLVLGRVTGQGLARYPDNQLIMAPDHSVTILGLNDVRMHTDRTERPSKYGGTATILSGRPTDD